MIVALVILFVIVKQIFWTISVPVWQTPDEQSHFAQLQWYAEKKNLTLDSKDNLSLEVYKSEETLGTLRDSSGNNKFTYHPEYKNPVIGTFNDRNLAEFNLPISSRTNYVGAEAAGYPPLYYFFSLPFYNLFYNNSLIDRVYAARISSVLLFFGLVIVTFKIGKEIWDDKFTPMVLVPLVAFHPMLSFVAAGIHPDNLLNLLASIGILMCLRLLKNGFSWKNSLVLLSVFVLGIYTKQFMIFLLPIYFATVLFVIGKKFKWILAGGALASPVLAFVFQIPIPYMPRTLVNNINIIEYLRFRLSKLFFEIWPWYWGVFRWLSLTLNPFVLKIITRIAAICGLGILVKIIRDRKSWEFKVLMFFILSSVSYLAYMLFWDWRLMQSTGFSLGIQGRYLFPNIVPHMAIFLIGFKSLFPNKWQRVAVGLLVILMVSLNVHTLLYLRNSY